MFTKTYVAGARNTEEFINPIISSIKCTINGTPNSLYSNGTGVKSIDAWRNILKKVGKVHRTFDEFDFVNDKFASWIDLRGAQDNTIHGDGKKFGNNDGDGLVINMSLESTETSVNCYIYTVSDAAIFVKEGRVKEYNK